LLCFGGGISGTATHMERVNAVGERGREGRQGEAAQVERHALAPASRFERQARSTAGFCKNLKRNIQKIQTKYSKHRHALAPASRFER